MEINPEIHNKPQAISNRNMFADYIKGILIILVVLGHIIQNIKYDTPNYWNDTLFRAIYVFHMPLFMGICGYFAYLSLQKRPALTFIKNRIISILLPLIVWGTFMTFAGITGKPSDMSLPHYLLLNITQSYWFIWAILIHSIVVGLIKLLKLDNKYILILSAVVAMLVPLFFTTNVVLTFTKDMYPFFIVGYLLASTDIGKIYRWCRKCFIPLLLVLIVSFYFWPSRGFIYFTPSDIYHLDIGIFRLAIGIVASTVFLIIAYIIYQRISQNKVVYYLSLIGQKTLEIYLIQGVLFFAMNNILKIEGCAWMPSVFYLIPTLFTVALIYLLIVTIEKYKPAGFILFGKR